MRWSLDAYRQAGVICQREVEDKRMTPTDYFEVGSSGGCGYHLPIDRTEAHGGGGSSEYSAPAFQIISGPVDLAAASVRINTANGAHWTVAPQGGKAGFGQAFYITRLPSDASVSEVIAYDSKGRELGRA